MSTCLESGKHVAAADGHSPTSGYAPDTQNGFHPDYFARLSTLEARHFWFRSRNRLLTWAVRDFFPDAGSFLEIGCGTGFVLAGMRHAFPDLRLAGSELFSEGLAFAAQRVPNADLVLMDARNIPHRSAFDLVGAFDVLEHIEEDQKVLLQMFQALRPGGGLLITVPQHPWLWSATDTYSYHKRRYTRAELSAKVKQAGFKLVHVTSFVTLLLPLMIVARARHLLTANRANVWSELEIGHRANAIAERIMDVERILITGGYSLPTGGSLLLVARRPES